MFTETEITVIWLTLKVAFVSTIVTTPLSIAVSWILARKFFIGKQLVEGLLTLPLVAPPVVTGYLLLVILGRNGVVGHWFYENFGIQFAFNFTALVIASVIVSVPLSIRTMKSAFELVNPQYEQASHTLGVSAFATFLRVTLPLSYPGIISGMVLTFARSLGEFGASITLAGNIEGKTQTIALKIYSSMQVPGQELQVGRLVAVSFVISIVAIVLSSYLGRRNKLF